MITRSEEEIASLKGHSSIEIRRCWTLSKDYPTQLTLWASLQTITLVQSERCINGSTENRYYISSLTSNASSVATLILD